LFAVGLLLLLSAAAARQTSESHALQRLLDYTGAVPDRRATAHGLYACAVALCILAAYAGVNHAKFGTLLDGMPIRLDLNYARTERLQNAGGKLLHLSNLPLNVFDYFNPRHIEFHRSFPWVFMTLHNGYYTESSANAAVRQRPRIMLSPNLHSRELFREAHADFVERYASIPAGMPFLFCLALVGAGGIVRDPGGRVFRVALVGAVVGSSIFLLSVDVSERYIHDAYPALLIAGCAGFLRIVAWPAAGARKGALFVLLLLALFSAWANIGFSLEYQREIGGGVTRSKQASYEEFVGRVDRLLSGILHYLSHSGRDAPIA
jgi:hypothetical protein